MKLFLDSSACAQRFVEEPGSQQVEALCAQETARVRTLDALHIACALAWGAELFASADRRQIAAAKAAGLKTRRV